MWTLGKILKEVDKLIYNTKRDSEFKHRGFQESWKSKDELGGQD